MNNFRQGGKDSLQTNILFGEIIENLKTVEEVKFVEWLLSLTDFNDTEVYWALHSKKRDLQREEEFL